MNKITFEEWRELAENHKMNPAQLCAEMLCFVGCLVVEAPEQGKFSTHVVRYPAAGKRVTFVTKVEDIKDEV